MDHEIMQTNEIRGSVEKLENVSVEMTEEKQILKERETRLLPVKNNFPYFISLSLGFGVIYTFCLYKNPAGITYPLFVAVACLCGIFACKKLEVPLKAGSIFLMITALLIGIGTCRTSEWFLVWFNGVALVLLGTVFGIHQFYDDRTWNIGKYFCSIIVYLCQAIGALPYPFSHFSAYTKQTKSKTMRKISLAVSGFLIAIPLLVVLVALLGAADAVFSKLIHHIVWELLKPATLFSLLFRTAFGTLSLYCLICGCCLHGLKQDVANRQKGEPIIAFVCMGTIGVVYLVFCGIQVIYLFLGKGSLPEGYTFSSYARQGFFQLLLVAFLNLIMVLCCLKYIRTHKALNMVLTLICGCTYIMLASAWYRMMLYVKEYRLTYLRISGLWFLAMLAVLMAGVTLIIWKNKFPLFSYCLVVVSVFYLALVWSKPGSIIAWDYVNHLDRDAVTDHDLTYLYYGLSADAASAIASLELTQSELNRISPGYDWNLAFERYYKYHARPAYKSLGIRNYNFSLAEARKLFPSMQE